MAHSVKIQPSANKALDALSKEQQGRILKAVNKLSDNPRPHGCEKLTGRNEYRIRIGDYRVIYRVHDDALIVLVIKIAHRGKAYRN
jgi:mRNA interferase RelE/StbE